MIASARRNRGVALLVVAWSVAVASVIAVRGLWSDEALSVRFAELTWHELWTIVRQFDPMFVLYYSLLHVWISGGSSEVWDRALSVVFASVTLPIVFRLAERVFDRRVAVAACGALAVQTPFLHEATEARPYALMTFGFALTMLFWREAVVTERHYGRVFAAAVVTLYAHAMAIFGLAALASTLVLKPRPAPAIARKLRVVATAVAIAIVPLAWSVAHAESPQDHWERNPDSLVAVVQLLAATLSGTVRILPVALLLMTIGYVASVREGKRRDATALAILVALPIVALALVSIVRPIYVSRYLAFISVPEALLVGRGLIAAFDARPWRFAAIAVAAYLAVVGIASARRLTGDGYDWGAVANVVRANVRSDDGLALEPSYELPPFRLALGGRVVAHVIFPRDERLATILEASEHFDERSAYAMERRFARVWVVRVARQASGPLAERALGAELARAYRLVDETRISGNAGDVDVDLFERDVSRSAFLPATFERARDRRDRATRRPGR